MRTYVTPHENMLKMQNFINVENIEGSSVRSHIDWPRYWQLHDDHRYVLFWYSCGKIKTIQRPAFEPSGYGSRVRRVRRYR